MVTKNDNNYTEKEEFNLSEIILEVILSENLKVLLCIVTDSQPGVGARDANPSQKMMA